MRSFLLELITLFSYVGIDDPIDAAMLLIASLSIIICIYLSYKIVYRSDRINNKKDDLD